MIREESKFEPYISERDHLGRLIGAPSEIFDNRHKPSTDRFSPSPVAIRDLSATILTEHSAAKSDKTAARKKMLGLSHGYKLNRYISNLPSLKPSGSKSVIANDLSIFMASNDIDEQ